MMQNYGNFVCFELQHAAEKMLKIIKPMPTYKEFYRWRLIGWQLCPAATYLLTNLDS